MVLEELELTDEATYKLLQRGDTLGVFQLDGGPMRALLRSMRPDTFEDISAVGALYRPGPMGADSHNKYARRKTGREPVEALHPELAEALEDVLGETYGLIVYQEQVMAIAQKLAGYTLGQADILRRAMGKKKKEELDKQFAGFSAGMTERGYSAGAIKTLWDTLLPFSDYAFNKAHSAAYGLVSYWTAYLKANFPAEYMAALLTSVKDDKDKSAIYLNECRRMKIQVLPPDVNESSHDFTPVGQDIRFGLTAIRNVGSNVVDGVVSGREEKGRYEDFNDFLDKVPAQVCNKRVIESLVKAGAFDEMKHRRRALVAIHETAVDQYVDIKRNEAIGQDSLFGGIDDDSGFGVSVAIPDLDEWDKMTLLGHEREMLGLYVSDHPLLGLEHLLANSSDCTVGQLMLDEDRADGSPITITGLVTGVQRKITKRGDAWGMVTLEDLDGAIDVLLFPSSWQLVGPPDLRGRDHHGQGPALAEQGPARDHGPGGQPPRPLRRPVRPGRHQAAADPGQRRHRGPPQGRAQDPPGRDRGAPQGADAGEDAGDADRRPPPGHAEPGAVRRPQAAPRPRMPDRMTPRPSSRPAVQLGLVVAALAAVGALAGVVWQWVWTPTIGVVVDHRWTAGDAIGLQHEFSGTGWYVVVGTVAGLLAGVAIGLLVDRSAAADAGRRGRRLRPRGLADAGRRHRPRAARPRRPGPHGRRRHPAPDGADGLRAQPVDRAAGRRAARPDAGVHRPLAAQARRTRRSRTDPPRGRPIATDVGAAG